MVLTNKQIYTYLINKFGKKEQITVAIEELSELQKELCKYLRYFGKIDVEHISEEMADVEIMLEQLKVMLNNSVDVEYRKKEKIQRTVKRYIEKEEQCSK